MNKKIQKNSAMKFRAEFYCFICSCFWALRRLHIFILKFSDLYIGQVGNAQVQKAPMQCVKPSQVHRPHDAQDVTNMYFLKHQHLSTTLFLMLLHAKENFLNFDSSTFQWSKPKSGAFVATSQCSSSAPTVGKFSRFICSYI